MKKYSSTEWISLEPIDRAQLLLVIEGLKRGTIVGGNYTEFMKILDSEGLAYQLTTPKYRLNPVMKIAKPEVLREDITRILTLPEEASSAEVHRVAGWFLNYPTCCTEEYVRERTPQEIAQNLHSNFEVQLRESINTSGRYPEVLDYRPPAYTPCSLNCPEGTNLLRSWKEALERLDPEATAELVYFNRASTPERFANHRYLSEENKRRSLRKFRV